MIKADILAFAAHPDDVELTCSGTLIKESRLGRKVVVVDLTAGEYGTRGSKEQRLKEAEAASAILGLNARENLGFRDCFFTNDEAHRLEIVRMIRKYRPEVVLCNAPSDRHPDHGRAATLVLDSVFLSRLPKIETMQDGVAQQPWHPRTVYHYIQDRYHHPDFVVDITEVWEERMRAIRAYASQFYNPDSKEKESPISSKDFMDFIAGRAMDMGRPAGFRYAEGFLAARTPAVPDLLSLL